MAVHLAEPRDAGHAQHLAPPIRVHANSDYHSDGDDPAHLPPTGGGEPLADAGLGQVDQVLGVKMRLGTGFGLINETVPLSPNPRTCFWGGWGGSLAVVDLDAQVTIAYAMNRMAQGLVGDIRGAMLVLSTYSSLAGI